MCFHKDESINSGSSLGLSLGRSRDRTCRTKRLHLTGTGINYLGRPARDEFILGFAAIGERTIREAVKRLEH